jgi:threonine synthase
MVEQGAIVDGNPLSQTILERYAEFFPFDTIDSGLSLSEGFTPLVPSQTAASRLAVGNIFFKNETENPTWSFKDRGTVVGVQHAVNCGFRRIGAVSSGNMAVSVAAYGARAGLSTFALVSASIPPEKLGPIAMYGATVIQVDGDYGDLYFRSLTLGQRHGIYFINSDVPLRVEGSKSIAFEICEQMNFHVPDFVVVPTSSGGNYRGILKGFEEFKRCGLITHVPTMVCAQAIENPFPPSGNQVLRKLRETDGIVAAVTDSEILWAQKMLAQEGIFGQPASAVPLAVVANLRTRGIIKEDHTVVCIVTGSGLKYTAVYGQHDLASRSCSMADLEMMISTQG